MVVNGRYFNSIQKVSVNQPAPEVKRPIQPNGDFERILRETLERKPEIKLSKHAEMRLLERNIRLSEIQKERIGQAVDKAEQKGVRDSLVLLDDIALVVNVKNRTIITAAGRGELKENVFTNIDGAVIV